MKWRDIGTAPRSPRDGDHIVLLGWERSTQVCRGFWDQDRWIGLLPGSDNRFVGSAITLRDQPTHWMPVTYPPTLTP